jgi:signal transduction histidine kinase/CheY-like chemotaxis protein/CHASE1-domain containing sensor protein
MKVSLWKKIFLSKDNSLVWGGFLLFAFSAFIFIIVEKNAMAERRMHLSKTAQEIEELFVARLSTSAHALHSTRAFLAQEEMAQPRKFENYVKDLDLFRNYPGMMGIGFLRVKGLGTDHLTCPIEMLEERGRKSSGWQQSDECRDPVKRRAILAAISENNFSMTRPLQVRGQAQGRLASGFYIYIPVYKSSEMPVSEATPAEGVLFAPFDVYDFFQSISGIPILEGEKFNFIIELKGGGQDYSVYRRFDETPPLFFEDFQKDFVLFGREFRLTIQPFNNYFQFKDLYLSYLVGLVLFLISVLILWLIKGNIYQLTLERKTNDILTSLYRETHEKVETLRKINDISRVLNKDLMLDKIVENLVHELEKLYPFDDIIVYMKDTKEGDELVISEHSHWQYPAYRSSVTLGELETQEFFKLRFSSDQDAAHKCANTEMFFKDPRLKKRVTDNFCRTLAVGADVSIVLLLFKKGGYYAVKDNEMLANICSQMLLIMRNSFLLKRVEDSNEAKNAFLANMSHEIRTPLNAIIGFSEMIFQEDLREERRNELKYLINRNGEQLIRIIDDILDLSKVEAGKIIVEKKEVNLAHLLHEVHSVISLRIQRKNLRFRIENETPIPKVVMTDNIRLKQILLNLIGNSIKFTEMGEIRLVIGHRTDREGHDVLYFRTIDTGIGISDEQQEKLFEVFSQGDESKTRKYGGAGLGLALSKKLGQELGGDLRLVRSTRGKGSEFELYIRTGPLRGEWLEDIQATIAEPEQKTKPPARLDGKQILLVEDSPDNQDIFNYFLKKYGAEVTTVADGLQAVTYAGEKNYDLILMDIQIPEIDGKEATRRIRQAGYENPIVAVTAHAMADEIESCLRAGCVGQITKPVVESDFIYQVNFYMKGYENASP